jgi:agmatinase
MSALPLPPWFLESELGRRPPGECLFHVIPAPLERSVSYGSGTAGGPGAILEASQQLELFDGEGQPATLGIFTQAPLDCGGDPQIVLREIAATVSRLISLEKVPVILGGEHTVSLGAFLALAERGRPAGIVQFDAHADLRDRYQDDPLSHACVMRRAHELGLPIFQIGVRSLSPEEHAWRREAGIGRLDAARLARDGLPRPLLPEDFPQDIYISVDVDVLDPAVMPATGTPEPGGLTWYPLMEALESATSGRRVLGFDVVELAPLPGLHAPDYTAARLVYNLMGFVARKGQSR